MCLKGFHLFIIVLAVSGLAKLEGEMIDCDYDEISKDICTKYQLTGIVVHSGQASGGHYYSYILHR
jgi:ubiquitin carboxyl-terminal hydrolase 9/24